MLPDGSAAFKAFGQSLDRRLRDANLDALGLPDTHRTWNVFGKLSCLGLCAFATLASGAFLRRRLLSRLRVCRGAYRHLIRPDIGPKP
jgi:hypothetical protein